MKLPLGLISAFSYLLFAVIVPALSPVLADEAFTPTIAILVRHAEKDTSPADDPGLTAEGTKRAERLAALLRKSEIKAIVTSQFRRTKETAKPLADAVGIPAKVVQLDSDPNGPGGLKVESLQKSLQPLKEHPGETVLIVGHSNSVPEMIRLLGGDTVPEIAETDFDNLFIVTLYAPGKAKVLRLKY